MDFIHHLSMYGSVDFNGGRVEYEEGFGSLIGEFWYEVHPPHCLTNQGQWQTTH